MPEMVQELPHKEETAAADGHHQGEGAPKKTEGSASFLRAARAGNLEKVLDYLKNGTDINTCNANGLNALHLASKEGHGEVVRELLKKGANVDAATKKGNTALHIASLAGQDEIVHILVEQGANVNVQSQNGFTPLYMAAQENHDKVVTYLLAHGANQSLATEDGFTPLAVALQQGHDKVVAILLENDTRGKVRLPALHIAAKKDDTKAAALLLQNEHNPDVTSKSGFTPLHIAAHYGNENIAKMLLEKGANVNYQARHNITPLHVAAKWGRGNMVTLLLAHGAVIDCKTRDLLTPLHCAARSGHDPVVDLLLEKGAPISAKTKNGLAPLHMAAQGDHVDSARILLYHRAPVDDVTVDYLTPLHVAAHCGHVKVAKLLLDRSADPNSRALNGFTPLHIACKKNRIKVVELLLKYKASIEATTESGLTPLHVAAFMGCMNIVIYLIQHGANPDVTTVRGETPLHLAARANQTDIIRILLRNGATVDARAREQQTPLHIASRLGNTDIVMLLLQHGAQVDAATKDQYTPLHIAAKEGQEEVASVLLEHNAPMATQTKKGFTPLHLAAKYGNINVAKLLLEKGADVDVQGKNQVTPLHVAAHYDHQNVALLLLEKKASPQAAAKNGYTPLHIAAKKNQMDIASTLVEYGANTNAESKAGFTPLHLASQEGHTDLAAMLIEHGAMVNAKAKNGLTPMHLCAQEDRVPVATVLVKHGAEIDPQTKAGYTPLHVACHFGQVNMVRFLLQHGAKVDTTTRLGYTPLHQAAQQGHAIIIKILLEHGASPNAVTSSGQTPLAIAQKLGYVSVVETLRTVTETTVITETTTVTEERYKVQAPETMQETFISDSEDEGEDAGADHQQQVLGEDMRGLTDDSLPMDKSMEQDQLEVLIQKAAHQPVAASPNDFRLEGHYLPDNVEIVRSAIHTGFLISFMVDARGGAMRGCRHSGVRIIVPPRKAPMPMRITCRYLRKDKLTHPPPLSEGEALASRVLEMGPAGAKFLGPVIIEVPHFASLRGHEREIVILRSDDGEHWKEHQLEATEDAVQEVLNESFDPEELAQLEDLQTTRITRILTNDFPQYFAIVTRVRQEVHAVGPEGGMISSTVVPQVQAVFPEGALTKTIKVSVQAQPVPLDLVNRLHGNRLAVSPIITVEPRRRKFHKPITLTIPLPQGSNRAMITQYQGQGQEPPTLRLLCSITGGQAPAQWEDITGTTQLNFVNDCVSFTTTVSARFWLMDCQTPRDSARMAQEIYSEAIVVPYMAKFVVFGRRLDPRESYLRVFCMTDDKEDKTLEKQEHFTEIAKSRDVEVLAGKGQFLEFAGNLVPITKSGDQLSVGFIPFQENRLPFAVRLREMEEPPAGRIAFMREPKFRAESLPPQHPICTLNVVLPEGMPPAAGGRTPPPGLGEASHPDLIALDRKYAQLKRPVQETIHKADIRLSDIARELSYDWDRMARVLDIPEGEIAQIRQEYPGQEAIITLRIWFERAGRNASGNALERALRAIGREDIIRKCMFNIETVITEEEKERAKKQLKDEEEAKLAPKDSYEYSRTTATDDQEGPYGTETVEVVTSSESTHDVDPHAFPGVVYDPHSGDAAPASPPPEAVDDGQHGHEVHLLEHRDVEPTTTIQRELDDAYVRQSPRVEVEDEGFDTVGERYDQHDRFSDEDDHHPQYSAESPDDQGRGTPPQPPIRRGLHDESSHEVVTAPGEVNQDVQYEEHHSVGPDGEDIITRRTITTTKSSYVTTTTDKRYVELDPYAENVPEGVHGEASQDDSVEHRHEVPHERPHDMPQPMIAEPTHYVEETSEYYGPGPRGGIGYGDNYGGVESPALSPEQQYYEETTTTVTSSAGGAGERLPPPELRESFEGSVTGSSEVSGDTVIYRGGAAAAPSSPGHHGTEDGAGVAPSADVVVPTIKDESSWGLDQVLTGEGAGHPPHYPPAAMPATPFHVAEASGFLIDTVTDVAKPGEPDFEDSTPTREIIEPSDVVDVPVNAAVSESEGLGNQTMVADSSIGESLMHQPLSVDHESRTDSGLVEASDTGASVQPIVAKSTDDQAGPTYPPDLTDVTHAEGGAAEQSKLIPVEQVHYDPVVEYGFGVQTVPPSDPTAEVEEQHADSFQAEEDTSLKPISDFVDFGVSEAEIEMEQWNKLIPVEQVHYDPVVEYGFTDQTVAPGDRTSEVEEQHADSFQAEEETSLKPISDFVDFGVSEAEMEHLKLQVVEQHHFDPVIEIAKVADEQKLVQDVGSLEDQPVPPPIFGDESGEPKSVTTKPPALEMMSESTALESTDVGAPSETAIRVATPVGDAQALEHHQDEGVPVAYAASTSEDYMTHLSAVETVGIADHMITEPKLDSGEPGLEQGVLEEEQLPDAGRNEVVEPRLPAHAMEHVDPVAEMKPIPASESVAEIDENLVPESEFVGGIPEDPELSVSDSSILLSVQSLELLDQTQEYRHPDIVISHADAPEEEQLALVDTSASEFKDSTTSSEDIKVIKQESIVDVDFSKLQDIGSDETAHVIVVDTDYAGTTAAVIPGEGIRDTAPTIDDSHAESGTAIGSPESQVDVQDSGSYEILPTQTDRAEVSSLGSTGQNDDTSMPSGSFDSILPDSQLDVSGEHPHQQRDISVNIIRSSVTEVLEVDIPCSSPAPQRRHLGVDHDSEPDTSLRSEGDSQSVEPLTVLEPSGTLVVTKHGVGADREDADKAPPKRASSEKDAAGLQLAEEQPVETVDSDSKRAAVSDAGSAVGKAMTEEERIAVGLTEEFVILERQQRPLEQPNAEHQSTTMEELVEASFAPSGHVSDGGFRQSQALSETDPAFADFLTGTPQPGQEAVVLEFEETPAVVLEFEESPARVIEFEEERIGERLHGEDQLAHRDQAESYAGPGARRTGKVPYGSVHYEQVVETRSKPNHAMGLKDLAEILVRQEAGEEETSPVEVSPLSSPSGGGMGGLAHQDHYAAGHAEEGPSSPPPSPVHEVSTASKQECEEEGFVDGSGNVVVQKRVTRVVTTTRTVLEGDGEPHTETFQKVYGEDEMGGGGEFQDRPDSFGGIPNQMADEALRSAEVGSLSSVNSPGDTQQPLNIDHLEVDLGDPEETCESPDSAHFIVSDPDLRGSPRMHHRGESPAETQVSIEEMETRLDDVPEGRPLDGGGLVEDEGSGPVVEEPDGPEETVGSGDAAVAAGYGRSASAAASTSSSKLPRPLIHMNTEPVIKYDPVSGTTGGGGKKGSGKKKAPKMSKLPKSMSKGT